MCTTLWPSSCSHARSVMQHRGADSLLLTPRLDTQVTFAKLFADIDVEGDVRYDQLDALLEDGPPPPTAVTSRHVQALRADLRAETMFHAAGLTFHLHHPYVWEVWLPRHHGGRTRQEHCRTNMPPDLMNSSAWFKQFLSIVTSCTVLTDNYRMLFRRFVRRRRILQL